MQGTILLFGWLAASGTVHHKETAHQHKVASGGGHKQSVACQEGECHYHQETKGPHPGAVIAAVTQVAEEI